MHLGVFGAGSTARVDPATMVAVGVAAEELGFESLWVGEHVVLPEPRTAASPLAATTPLHDPLIALTYLAARTSRVRLGTGILILPMRPPAVLAKQVASLDVLSGGRVLLGIGVGGLPEELAVAGVAMGERGRRADEHLDALKALWEMDRPRYEGRWVTIRDVDAHPRPQQRPVPIIVGGHSPAALRRAVLRGQGWYGFGLEVAATAELLSELRAIEQRVERPAELGPLEITVTPPLRSTERAAYEDLGVDRLVMVPSNSLDRDGLLRWLEERQPR
jgi:probable F420-dependent oxidoreductase